MTHWGDANFKLTVGMTPRYHGHLDQCGFIHVVTCSPYWQVQNRLNSPKLRFPIESNGLSFSSRWRFHAEGAGLIEMWLLGWTPGFVIHTKFGRAAGRSLPWRPGASARAACCHVWEDLTWAWAEPAQSFHPCASNMEGTSTLVSYFWLNVENTAWLNVCPSRSPWLPILRFPMRLKKARTPPPLTEEAKKWPM